MGRRRWTGWLLGSVLAVAAVPLTFADAQSTSPGSGGEATEGTGVNPEITIDKTVYGGHDGGASCPGIDSLSGFAGDDITYCFVVTNTGDATLFNATVDDPALGIDETDMTLVSGSLGVLGTSSSATLVYLTTIGGDLVNTATATADTSFETLEGFPPTVSDTDSATVTEQAAGIDLQKTVYAGHDSGASCPGGDLLTGTAGDDATYCFVVTNTGDVALENITVDDADLGIDETDMTVVSGSLASLGLGASVTLAFDATLTADLVNTATASGTVATEQPAEGGLTPSDSDSATVDVVAPDISLSKTVYAGHDSGASCPGGETVVGAPADPVTYCFVVTNTGDQDLANITVDDADLGIDESDMSVVSGTPSLLEPSESVTLAYETTIDGDLTNTATAGGTAEVGADPTDTDTASVDEVVTGPFDCTVAPSLDPDHGAPGTVVTVTADFEGNCHKEPISNFDHECVAEVSGAGIEPFTFTLSEGPSGGPELVGTFVAPFAEPDPPVPDAIEDLTVSVTCTVTEIDSFFLPSEGRGALVFVYPVTVYHLELFAGVGPPEPPVVTPPDGPGPDDPDGPTVGPVTALPPFTG